MGFLPWTSAVALGTLILVGAETKQCKQQCREMCKEKPNKCTADANGAECPSDMCAILPYGYPWNPPVEPMYKWCKFSASVARAPGQKVYVGVAVDWLYPNSTFYCGDHEHIITSPPARASFETWHQHEGRRCSNDWQPSDCRSACKNWCRAACNCVWSKGSEPTQYSQYAFKNGWECVRSKAVCSVDCEMSDWAEWEPCSKTCAGGEELRSRTIVQTELYGGKPCTTNLTEARSCNTHKCPGKVKSGSACGKATAQDKDLECTDATEKCMLADGSAICDTSTTGSDCICRKVIYDGICSTTNAAKHLDCEDPNHSCLNSAKDEICDAADGCVCANRSFPHCLSTNGNNRIYGIYNSDNNHHIFWRNRIRRIDGNPYKYAWRNGTYEGRTHFYDGRMRNLWTGSCRYNGTIGDECTDDGDGWLEGTGCGDMKFLCCEKEVKLK